MSVDPKQYGLSKTQLTPEQQTAYNESVRISKRMIQIKQQIAGIKYTPKEWRYQRMTELTEEHKNLMAELKANIKKLPKELLPADINKIV